MSGNIQQLSSSTILRELAKFSFDCNEAKPEIQLFELLSACLQIDEFDGDSSALQTRLARLNLKLYDREAELRDLVDEVAVKHLSLGLAVFGARKRIKNFSLEFERLLPRLSKVQTMELDAVLAGLGDAVGVVAVNERGDVQLRVRKLEESMPSLLKRLNRIAVVERILLSASAGESDSSARQELSKRFSVEVERRAPLAKKPAAVKKKKRRMSMKLSRKGRENSGVEVSNPREFRKTLHVTGSRRFLFLDAVAASGKDLYTTKTEDARGIAYGKFNTAPAAPEKMGEPLLLEDIDFAEPSASDAERYMSDADMPMYAYWLGHLLLYQHKGLPAKILGTEVGTTRRDRVLMAAHYFKIGAKGAEDYNEGWKAGAAYMYAYLLLNEDLRTEDTGGKPWQPECKEAQTFIKIAADHSAGNAEFSRKLKELQEAVEKFTKAEKPAEEAATVSPPSKPGVKKEVVKHKKGKWSSKSIAQFLLDGRVKYWLAGPEMEMLYPLRDSNDSCWASFMLPSKDSGAAQSLDSKVLWSRVVDSDDYTAGECLHLVDRIRKGELDQMISKQNEKLQKLLGRTLHQTKPTKLSASDVAFGLLWRGQHASGSREESQILLLNAAYLLSIDAYPESFYQIAYKEFRYCMAIDLCNSLYCYGKKGEVTEFTDRAGTLIDHLLRKLKVHKKIRKPR